ncbi:MAG: hypothetical protein ACYDA2_07060 [Acidimicrobiales bacterium]
MEQRDLGIGAEAAAGAVHGGQLPSQHVLGGGNRCSPCDLHDDVGADGVEADDGATPFEGRAHRTDDPPDTTVGLCTAGATVVGVAAVEAPEVDEPVPGVVVGTEPLEEEDVEEVLPGAEAEAAPGSWWATTPAMAAAPRAERPAAQRATRRGRSRAWSRWWAAPFRWGREGIWVTHLSGPMLGGQAEPAMKAAFGFPVEAPTRADRENFTDRGPFPAGT